MAKSVFYIPNGPKNLQPLFLPSFQDIEEYFVEVKDSLNTVISTGNICTVVGNNDDFVRLHFLNALGAIDSISFMLVDVQQDPKSSTSQKPTSFPLVKSEHGINRYNVRSTDILTFVTTDFHEDDMPFLDELVSSPMAWMQWQGTQGQPDDYIPIIINDQKVQKRKLEDRFTYEIAIEVRLSHEKFVIRN